VKLWHQRKKVEESL